MERYYTAHISGWTLRINSAFPGLNTNDPSREIFDNMRGPFEFVHKSASTEVYKSRVSFGGEKKLFIKRFFLRGPVDFFKQLVRPSRAMRALAGCRVLNKVGLKTPVNAAVCEKKVGTLVLENVLISEEMEDCSPLYEYIENDLRSAQARVRKSFFRKLGAAAGKMHAGNVFHGDLRPGNILVTGAPDEPDFYFIDNEKTIRSYLFTEKRLIKNLVQINMLERGISRTERLSFLCEYLKVNTDMNPKRKYIAREVYTRTAERIKRRKLRDENSD